MPLRLFSSCGAQASHCHGLSHCGARAPGHTGFSNCSVRTQLNSCGACAQLLHSIRDLPRSGIKPVSPALADGFPTTEPPGKPLPLLLEAPGAAHFQAFQWFFGDKSGFLLACLLIDDEFAKSVPTILLLSSFPNVSDFISSVKNQQYEWTNSHSMYDNRTLIQNLHNNRPRKPGG